LTMTPSRAVQIFKNRKHGHDDREALPWWGYAGLLGWFTAAWLEPFVAGMLPADNLVVLWIVRLVLAVPGAIVGVLIAKRANAFFAICFKAFNRMFDAITRFYGGIVSRFIRFAVIVLVVYAGLLGLTAVGLKNTPIGFIPSQDKGYLVVNVQLPDSSSLDRTIDVLKAVEMIAQETEGVAHTVGIAGQSVVLNAVSSNYASMFIVLDDFHHRHHPHLGADAIAQHLRKRLFTEVIEGQVAVFGAPPVDGLGSAGGFKVMVQDRGNVGLSELQQAAEQVAFEGNQRPGLIGLFNGLRSDTPQLFIDVDRTKCKSMGVPLGDVFQTLQVCLGGAYVNDFYLEGRTWQVNVQADAPFRMQPDDIRQLKVRNLQGGMVPLGTLATIDDRGGPIVINRYNMYPAAPINGGSLPGVSSGDMVKRVENVMATELPAGVTFEWTELTYLQLLEGSAAIFAFIGAVLLVFQLLAAQYESWSMPMAVLMVVPMCLLSAVIGLWITHLDINIFVQVGFIVLVGLAAKNAILIVETARERRHAGRSRADAAKEAATERLRPIIMTSLAFILGVLPLVISHGAGAEMRRTLGIAVFSGMLGVTLFGIFLTPVFYVVLDWFEPEPTPKHSGETEPHAASSHGPTDIGTSPS
ncbi:MAG: efflux RND transporter permease subunit, partial [Planctomycetaceae bacterium]|nr:efflux RND transporter permease subunit [Planctomycetaceae bacterium]